MTIASLFVNLIGLLIFLFIFWKKLKEDYSSEIIFRSGNLILIGVLIFYLISLNYFGGWYLWFGFIGGLLGLITASYFQKIRFFETLEAFVISGLPWVSIGFLHDSVINSSLNSFLAFVATLFYMFLAYWLDNKYKNFFWYKSGKIGISGLIVLEVIFLTRFMVAFFQISVLSFVGKWDMVISSVFFIISLGLIFHLTKREV